MSELRRLPTQGRPVADLLRYKMSHAFAARRRGEPRCQRHVIGRQRRVGHRLATHQFMA
jgi:hypothetical protein